MNIVDLGVGLTLQPFAQCWQQQRELHQQRVLGLIDDTVLLVEHPSTYTAGKRTSPHEYPTDASPVIRVDRGGRLTWHGPGQLVGYPILALPQPLDVVQYVRTLEELLIATCAALGLPAHRVPGRSGVWVGQGDDPCQQRKVAAVGVRVAQGVSLHGFALNVNCDLSPYAAIIPCGIADAGVTSISREVGQPVTVLQVLPVLTAQLRAHLHHLAYPSTPSRQESAHAC